jgi:subtilisin family serine protease
MHCSCEVPGEVLVLPREGASGQFQNERFEVVYSARRILDHYAEISGDQPIPEEAWGRLERQPSQPFVIRVREGEEHRTAMRLVTDRRVSAAIPNISIAPAAASIDRTEVASVIRYHGAEAAAPVCGSGVRVAVLDTGVDATLVPSCTVQYDVASPAITTSAADPDGHGSVVAAIIHQIAPSATIYSLKVFPNGTLGGLVVGAQLAIAVAAPHVINLSLGLDISRDRCRKCGYPNGQQFPERLVHSFFMMLENHATPVKPLVVAASGNESRMLLPARCDSVLAVGAFDMATDDRPDYARYSRVPSARFIMADGGSNSRPVGHSGWGKPLYGTSFSAAVASGIAARFACAYVDHTPCGRPSHTINDLGSQLRRDIARAATRVTGHTADVHGLGIVRYR